MLRNKNLLKAMIASIGLGVMVVSFQNCAPNQMESVDFSSLSSLSVSQDYLPFPSGTRGVILNPGQKVTLKIKKPTYATGNNAWIVVTDNLLLNPNYDEAVPTADGGYLLIPIEVVSDAASRGLPRTLTMNLSSGWSGYSYTSVPSTLAAPQPISEDGLYIQISEETSYPLDATAELCLQRPSHRFCTSK